MSNFILYRKRGLAEMRPYVPGEPMDGISISAQDTAAGSPVLGDMIARNPNDHNDLWLVSKKFLEDNYEEL